MFVCQLVKQCINESLHCDGKKDCQDGTDEWFDCPEITTVHTSYSMLLYHTSYSMLL